MVDATVVEEITEELERQDEAYDQQTAEWLKEYLDQDPESTAADQPTGQSTGDQQIPQPTSQQSVNSESDQSEQSVVSSPKAPTKEQQQSALEAAQERLLELIDKEVKDISFNPEEIPKDLLQMYITYLTGFFTIPSSGLGKLDLNNYINSITTLGYNCFDSPNVLIQHNIPSKVAIARHLNQLFGQEFVNVSEDASNRYNFANLPKELVKFLWIHKEVGTSKLEYLLIKSFIVKLIICLNTNVELGLCNGQNNITTEFTSAVMEDVSAMKYLQSASGKTAKSWKTFVSALLGTTDKQIYSRPKSNANSVLNGRIKTAWESDFMLETLLANILKTYVPSISLNYFYAVRSVYLTARLLSVYLEKFRRPTELLRDLSAIAGVGGVIYENLSFIFRIIPRSMPKYNHEISHEFEMYITNHLVVGGQYYLLKMFEKCLPALSEIVKNL